MVHDFLGWLMKYSEGSWADVWNGFGYFGLHPVFHIINYGTFRLLGYNQLAWCIVFACLHGLTAFLLFSFLRKVCHSFDISQGFWIAFFFSNWFFIGPLSDRSGDMESLYALPSHNGILSVRHDLVF